MANGSGQGVRRNLEVAKSEIEGLIAAVQDSDQQPDDVDAFITKIDHVVKLITDTKNGVGK